MYYFSGENLAMQREIDKTSKLAAASSSGSISYTKNNVKQIKILPHLGWMESFTIFGLLKIWICGFFRLQKIDVIYIHVM